MLSSKRRHSAITRFSILFRHHPKTPPDRNRPWNCDEGGFGENIMGNSVVSLTCDQVLAVAQLDAARVYKDLSHYRIQLVLENDGWHVDYELKDARLKGGWATLYHRRPNRSHSLQAIRAIMSSIRQ